MYVIVAVAMVGYLGCGEVRFSVMAILSEVRAARGVRNQTKLDAALALIDAD
jgi:anaerobic C4-dicarboxylate transporter